MHTNNLFVQFSICMAFGEEDAENTYKTGNLTPLTRDSCIKPPVYQKNQ